jgi:hypothetical protein
MLAGGFILFLGAGLLALGLYHGFEHGSCSTTGYSANYGPVPTCAKGIGWWVGLLTLGIFISLAGGFLAGMAGGAIVVPVIFTAVGAPFIALGLRGGHQHLALGMSSGAGQTFALIFGACFVLGGLVWGWFGVSGVVSDPDFQRGSSLGVLVTGALGIGAAFGIAAGINGAIGPPAPNPTAVSPTSSLSMFHAAPLKSALSRIESRIPPDARAFWVNVYPGYVDVIADTPTSEISATVYVDGRFVYDDTGTPTPDQKLFPLSSADPSAPPKIAQQISSQYHVPESQIRYMLLESDPISGKLVWRVYSGPYNYTVDADQVGRPTPSHGSAPPAPKPRPIPTGPKGLNKAEKLAKCIQAAGTDVAKIQACAAQAGG